MTFTWNATGRRPSRHYQLIVDARPTIVRVHHCGHPTALWPYYITFGPESSPMILDANGRGFQLLKKAQARAIELYVESSTKKEAS